MSVFALNTERYFVSVRIQSEFGKIRTRITPNTNTFYAVYVKNKSNVALDIFLDFAEVKSYLTFNIFAWKRVCTISFELQIPRTSSTTFSKALIQIYQREWTLQLSDGPFNFYGSLNFSTPFLKSLKLLYDCKTI